MDWGSLCVQQRITTINRTQVVKLVWLLKSFLLLFFAFYYLSLNSSYKNVEIYLAMCQNNYIKVNENPYSIII